MGDDVEATHGSWLRGARGRTPHALTSPCALTGFMSPSHASTHACAPSPEARLLHVDFILLLKTCWCPAVLTGLDLCQHHMRFSPISQLYSYIISGTTAAPAAASF